MRMRLSAFGPAAQNKERQGEKENQRLSRSSSSLYGAKHVSSGSGPRATTRLDYDAARVRTILDDALLLAAANTVATKTLLVSIQAARQVKSSQMGRHIFILT